MAQDALHDALLTHMAENQWSCYCANSQCVSGHSVAGVKIGLAWELALEWLGTVQSGPTGELCTLQTHRPGTFRSVCLAESVFPSG